MRETNKSYSLLLSEHRSKWWRQTTIFGFISWPGGWETRGSAEAQHQFISMCSNVFFIWFLQLIWLHNNDTKILLSHSSIYYISVWGVDKITGTPDNAAPEYKVPLWSLLFSIRCSYYFVHWLVCPVHLITSVTNRHIVAYSEAILLNINNLRT